MFDKAIYIERRKKLVAQVQTGVILLLGNEESGMSYKDNWYTFRQDSTFLYFIGLDKASLVAIIDIDNNAEILFGNDLTIDEIVWNGKEPSIAGQAYKTGITVVKPLSTIEGFLKNCLSKKQTIRFLPPYRPEHTIKLISWLPVAANALQTAASVSLIKAVVALRSIKAPEEIIELEKAVDLSVDMHLAAMQHSKAGLTEAGVAGKVHGVAISGGGNISFPIILTTNGQILHNHYTQNILEAGSMVLCDCGAENDLHYAGDLTRTFPVNATFSTQQKELYNIVLAAHNAAANALQPQMPFKDVHLLACQHLVEGLKQLGIMKGDSRAAVEAGAHALFFQCGLGHMLGLDVHDMENLGEQYVGYNDTMQKSKEFGLKSLRLAKPLQPGFVLTVEPGLYFIPELIDMWSAEKKHSAFINYNNIEAYKKAGGVRVENDYLITENGSRLLGKHLPITVEEIEAVRQAAL